VLRTTALKHDMPDELDPNMGRAVNTTT